MKKNLSYSGYSTYVTCPYKYDLHYNQKIKPETTPFHLVFGSAVDKALNDILVGKSKENALKHAGKELFRLFKEKITFEQSDFDVELFSILTEVRLVNKFERLGWKGKNLGELGEKLFSIIQMDGALTESQYSTLKYLIFYSGLEKVSLMIDAFNDYVMPRIEEVIGVQEQVKRGILDVKARLKGIEGVTVCDNKTSARDYPLDAVLNSVQLAGYGAETGAYFVFNKTVKKNRTKECSICKKNGTGQRHKTCDAVVDGLRCGGEWNETITPEIVPQIIVDKVPEHNRVMVEQAYQDVEKLIETKVFPKNLNSCGQQYGKPCPYINLCWKNDMSGLKKESK
jgi:hypothetical protein